MTREEVIDKIQDETLYLNTHTVFETIKTYIELWEKYKGLVKEEHADIPV